MGFTPQEIYEDDILAQAIVKYGHSHLNPAEARKLADETRDVFYRQAFGLPRIELQVKWNVLSNRHILEYLTDYELELLELFEIGVECLLAQAGGGLPILAAQYALGFMEETLAANPDLAKRNGKIKKIPKIIERGIATRLNGWASSDAGFNLLSPSYCMPLYFLTKIN